MSRPIKFRGQPIDSGDWVYGYYVYTFEIGYNSQGYNDVPPRKHYIFGDSDDFCEVKPETVGQYTGLNDRNGKEIYEGDIVYIPQFDWTGYVVFTGDCQYVLKGKTELGNDGYVLFTQIYLDECEVIGNIYEHPHLLKGDSTDE
ncbi:YopX family protein [Paenibacillus apiarius]|uniref:YopX family protein n=1 Tax=Paenibacillus apiarius TaxID=46240 RepID=UPI003B3A9B8D